MNRMNSIEDLLFKVNESVRTIAFDDMDEFVTLFTCVFKFRPLIEVMINYNCSWNHYDECTMLGPIISQDSITVRYLKNNLETEEFPMTPLGLYSYLPEDGIYLQDKHGKQIIFLHANH